MVRRKFEGAAESFAPRPAFVLFSFFLFISLSIPHNAHGCLYSDLGRFAFSETV
jgi:hypothetical protein